METNASNVKILSWKWYGPKERRELEELGPFNVRSLLQVAKLDSDLMRAIKETELDPISFREAFSSQANVSHLTDALAAMTTYALIFKDIPAAKAVITALYLVKDLNLPDQERRVLSLLEDMLDVLVSREGLAPYIKPPESVRGVVTVYPPSPSKEDLMKLPTLSRLGNELVEMVKGGKGGLFLVEVSEDVHVVEARAMANLVAGLAGAKLYYSPISSLSSEDGLLEVMDDLKRIAEERGPFVLYMEGAELLFPGEMLMPKEEPVRWAMESVMGDILKALDSLRSRGPVILVTRSSVMLSEKLTGRATKIIAMETGGESEGREPEYLG